MHPTKVEIRRVGSYVERLLTQTIEGQQGWTGPSFLGAGNRPLLHRFLSERFARLASLARGTTGSEAGALAEALLNLAAKMDFNVKGYWQMLSGGPWRAATGG